MEANLRVPNGPMVGQPFKLTPSQIQWMRGTFKTRGGRRVVRLSILSVGKKWGKSTLIAAIVLCFLCGPLAMVGENSELISAANARKQAAIIFRAAKQMTQKSPMLTEYLVTRESAKEIFCPTSGSTFVSISADATTAQGANPRMFVYDELGQCGAMSALREALTTAQAAQSDPLEIIISTQAPTDDALLSVLIDDALVSVDESVYVQLHAADKELDSYSEEAWRAANPNIGINTDIGFYQYKARVAKNLPSEQPGYENLLLNRRVSPFVPILTPELYKAAARRSPDPDLLLGARCWAGLDLSCRTDLTALALLFAVGNDIHFLFRFFAPEIGVKEREDRDKRPYTAWAERGFLTLTPGKSVSLGYVIDVLNEVKRDYDLVTVGYDRYRSDFLEQIMVERNSSIPMTPVGQGKQSMTPAIEEFTSWALDERLVVGNNPIMQFCVASCVIKTDEAENKQPDKKRSTGRIDGVTAALCATFAYAIAERPKPQVTVSDLDKFLIMV